MKYAVVGAVVTAAVSTIGDYLWANVIPHRVVVYWFVHAIVLFATIGACLGVPSRKPILGAAGCIVIGCSATLSYWFLQPLLGYAGAMFFLTSPVVRERRRLCAAAAAGDAGAGAGAPSWCKTLSARI